MSTFAAVLQGGQMVAWGDVLAGGNVTSVSDMFPPTLVPIRICCVQ
jgi:hypothetical protein